MADCLPRFDTVAQFRAATLSNAYYSSVYLASYGLGTTPTPNDGAAGVFVKAACGTNSDNGGSILQDSSGKCFYRQNLNGDLRQWGVIKGSSFDASLPYPASPVDAGLLLVSTVWPALKSAGITRVTTGQVSIFFDSTLTNPVVNVPATSSLDCGATGGPQITGANYLGQPGTIFLRHGAYIHFQNGKDASSIQNCLILPSWLLPNTTGTFTNTQAHTDCSAPSDSGTPNSGVSFNYPAQTYDDLEAIRSNMLICGDVAVFYDASSGGTSHDLWAYGFDNPFYLSKNDHSALNNSAADGDICYYSKNGGGITRVSDSTCDVNLTHGVVIAAHSTNTDCVQVNPSGGNVCNSEYWQIANIVPAPSTNSFGRHNCQVQLVLGQGTGSWNVGSTPTPPPLSLIPNSNPTYLRMAQPTSKPPGTAGDPVNFPMWIANLSTTSGAISCLGHGAFAVNYAGTTTISGGPYNGESAVKLDLLESEFGMNGDVMSATATWDTCLRAPCTVRIVSGDVDAMEVGELVTGTGIPSNATIVSVVRTARGIDPYDGYIAEIVIDQALTVAHNSGSDASLSISSDTNGTGVYVPSSTRCDDGHAGDCAFFHTGARSFAGASDAGIASALLPESGTHRYAAGYLDNGTAGLDLLNAFSFGHHFGYVVQDANSTVMTNRNGDGNGELDDLGEQFYIVNGNSNKPVVQGSKGGGGTAIVNNFYSLNDQAINTTTTVAITSTSLVTSVGVSSTATLPSDQGVGVVGGKGTAGICNSGGTGCDNNHPEEYITYEITASGTPGTIAITSRGNYFTTPHTYLTTANIIPTTISRPDYCNSFSAGGGAVTNQGLNVFENVGGCLQIVNLNVPGIDNGFVGANAVSTSITNSNLPALTFLYENAAAFASVSGCGNTLNPNQAWNCAHTQTIATSITASTTIDATANYWPCDATAGGVTLTVPLGSTLPNQEFHIKKVDASANVCTIIMSGTDILDGSNSLALTALNQGVSFSNSNGSTAWYIKNAPPLLAHGQVYLSLLSSTTLQLCPFNGSGLIVGSQLISIPSGCLYLKNTSTTGSSVLNYIYVASFEAGVANVLNDSGAIRLVFVGPTPFSVNDQVLASCEGIGGTTEANVSGLGTMKSTATMNFNSGSFVNTYSAGGTCVLLGLRAVTTSHVTSPNGVEAMSGHPEDTLVGMVYVRSSQALNDSATKRDVASWFNRQIKTCTNVYTANRTVSATSYGEPNTEIECEFVNWGTAGSPGPAIPVVLWSASGSSSNNTVGDGTAVAAGFNTSMTNTVEQTASVAGTTQMPFAISGAAPTATPLTEGKNIITLLAKSITGGVSTIYSAYTSLEAQIMQ